MPIRSQHISSPVIVRLAGRWMILGCLGAVCLYAQNNSSVAADAAAKPAGPVVKGGGDGALAAKTAWGILQDRATSAATRAGGPGTIIDWAGIAADAQKFRRDFPDDGQARAAAKIAANALIRADDNAPELSPNAKAFADTFVADSKNPVRDRLAIKITLEQAKLARAKFADQKQYLLAHSVHARDLIARYPEQPEGYGYLLALAKRESTEGTHQLADELLASNAPERFKLGARRVLDRLALVGHPLKLSGAEAAIAGASGKALVVYTWRAQDEGFLRLIQQLEKIGDTRFVGVNLDEKVGPARVKAASFKLPGVQFYDGGDLNGPMAAELKIIMGNSLYLADGDGVVTDVNGQFDAAYKLVRLVREEEGNP